MSRTPSGDQPHPERLYVGVTLQVDDFKTYREVAKLLAAVPGVRLIFKTCGTEYPRIEVATPKQGEAA